jgi:hypothetical protein
MEGLGALTAEEFERPVRQDAGAAEVAPPTLPLFACRLRTWPYCIEMLRVAPGEKFGTLSPPRARSTTPSPSLQTAWAVSSAHPFYGRGIVDGRLLLDAGDCAGSNDHLSPP